MTSLITDELLSALGDTGTPGSDETDLLTWWVVTFARGRVTNVLVVTTTVRVLNRVHGNTTSSRPRVTLCLVLVERGASLQHWLVDTTSSCNDADHGTGHGWDRLLLAGRELDTGLASVKVVCNDGGVVARASGESATVTSLGFHGADDGTFWHRGERQDVADGECRLLTAVDELTGRHAFSSDESHLLDLVSVWVLEVNLCERSTTTGVVDDVLDNALDVAVLFGVVLVSELGRTLTVVGVSLEDATGTLTLSTDDSTSERAKEDGTRSFEVPPEPHLLMHC